MTGYLQRLAASVGSRPSRIRPVVDPLYAGGAGRFGAEAGAGELALEEESVLVDSLARQEPDTNRLPHEAIEPTRDPGDRRAPGPVVEPTRAGPPAPLVAIPPSLRPGAQTPAAEPPAAQAGTRLPFEVRIGASMAPRLERRPSLVRRPAVRPEADRGPPLVRRPALRPEAERDRSEAARRAANGGPQATAPDEIRINIGRVEVIAAPPPSPRAQRPNRATSLEDYLRSVSARRR